MKNLKVTALLLVFLGLSRSALAIPYNLATADATLVSGNTVSTFYEVSGSGVETPGTTAINLFSGTTGGDEDLGFWVNISFGGNPQPFLTSAFLKASNQYLWWDAADLAGFNAGTFDSIILWNNALSGINHYTGGKNPQLKYHGTSHAGVNGTLGEVVIDPHGSVPDASSTVALLGLGMIGLFVASRRRSSK